MHVHKLFTLFSIEDNNKHLIYQFCSMQLQKEVKSDPKQPSCKNSVRPPRMMWNLKWHPRNGCKGRLKAKFLITTIQLNLCCLLHISLRFGTKFTWIVIIRILPLAYHHITIISWPPLWILHLFSQQHSCEPHTVFTTGLFWIG